MKSMGWTTKDTLKSINSEVNFPQQQQQQQLPQQYSKCKSQPGAQTSCCDRCSCECIKKIESTILRSPTKAKENDEPVRKSPKKAPHYTLPQQCNRQERLEPLQQTSQQSSKINNAKQQAIKKPSKTNLISGGVELVPLLAKRRDDRPISLSTTDITKYKINKSR